MQEIHEVDGVDGVDREREFVPAAPQLWLYDILVALLSREGKWRPALIRQIDPKPGETIADIGCGTGTLLTKLGRIEPKTTLLGLDPDDAILERARPKLADAGVDAQLENGFAREAAAKLAGRAVDKIVSSLVFHQVPVEEKRAGLASMFAALVPGGELHVADYGLQRTALMKRLFRIVGSGDGYENTEPNGEGILPVLMAEVGFEAVEETHVIPTPTGSISVYRARRSA